MSERKKVGRPSRKDELKKAIEEASIDPAIVDPWRVLSAIAIDSKVAAMTRITACVALIEHPRRAAEPGKSDIMSDSKPGPASPADPTIPDDEITQRALQIMKTGTSR
jgi:hypothetical protein